MKKLFGIIYKITNKINGKMYIGQTRSPLKSRWRRHYTDKKEKCRLIARAIKKYGKENFIVEEIHKCYSIEEMNYFEKYYIKELNTMSPKGYNLNSGGDKYLVSEETRKLLSFLGTGRSKSDEHRNNLSVSHTGKILPKTHRIKISESGKIAQNKPEVIQQKKETWANKSEEEKSAHRKKCHDFHIIYQNLPEERQSRSDFHTVYQNLPEVKQKKSKSQTGEKNSNAKLRNEQVLLIRELWSTNEYTQRELGGLFGATRSGISDVINGGGWKI